MTATTTYPGLVPEAYRARNRTYEEIRQKGAVGNLNDGIEIELQGVRTRLIAWPGNGFLMGSLHVLTLAPGEASVMYQYDQAEEALFCLKGEGEVFLRGRWVAVEPGDVAYIPEGIEHAVRNPAGSGRDLVVMTQIAPPPADIYVPSGLYNVKRKRLDLDLIEDLKRKAAYGNLSPESELRYSERNPEMRPWNLGRAETRQGGALFNIFKGATYGGIGVPMRLVLWPGQGTRISGLHTGLISAGGHADQHIHPAADDCIFVWKGKNQAFVGGDWVTLGPLEAAMAPAGVEHGGRPYEGDPSDPAADSLLSGWGAPAQTDVYLQADLYVDGKFASPPFERLELPPALA